VKRPRRLGVFGGTFDPVHAGHLMIASEAAARLALDRVLFVPARRPAHKRSRGLADVEHRMAMLRLAIRGNPAFGVSRLEADRDGVSFTVRTLEALRTAGERQLYFLMGQDSLEEFATWREPERILELARLAVVPRGEREMPAISPRLRRRVVYLRVPRIAIASSEIRRRFTAGLPVRYWTPDPVIRYVIRHGLYGTRTRRR
jgi:nicotinate-nucleotide adenylyltransferase